mmetsp:Transcript_980/g.1221  ORF Transcript_980/g.1221 Transcript_980/m.1221 type:complete len:489 (+) Transcript_980:143-1609(+)|eukprot:CAMPEP_0194153722 /NCGR_PEP_ID=MMETSP0152-20130528/57523_1 /TAXON_ID=1049557 /ORGANISM="Thalassiothrix antarctica, Strain L6-D1" /LENGTH=488 /DNA_ID=CAMNT_0038859221 /DNA_START=114 /DNA_END=1580 /DNA_ORIENTATION=+
MDDTSPEQLALIGFAARLGTSVCREDGVASDTELRSEAQLLMSLLSSNPVSISENAIKTERLGVIGPYFDKEPSCDDKPLISSKISNFSFSCPSLSLDECQQKSVSCASRRKILVSDEGEYPVLHPMTTPAPVISMGRPLVVDDRDALRLSAEAMARNILNTFQKAVQWRKKCWIKALARPLVTQEKKMKEAGASEEKLRDLLDTPVAMVIASLNESQIEVLDARTSFRVMPHTWKRSQKNYTQLMKKMKTSHYNEKSYVTAHVLTFQTVLNFSSPCGYSEVTLEAPGVIEGTFERPQMGEVKLIGVSVEIDTKVLATMIEKSSRIIARTSAESFMNPTAEIESRSEVSDLLQTPNEDVTLTPHKTPDCDTTQLCLLPTTIITPRRKSSQLSYNDTESFVAEKTCAPSLQNKRDVFRMVSPQPRLELYEAQSLDTPLPAPRMLPSLISPDPTAAKSNPEKTQFLTFGSKAGPSLPALVEVACAAMHTQ